MPIFTSVFVALLALSTGVRCYLIQRQIRHVAAHRGRVPEDFAAAVDLAAHQRAADYTCARARARRASALFEAALLLALTLGGGLDLASRLVALLPGGAVLHGAVLILAVLGVTSLLEVPFAWHRAFGIDARFGFNRMTPSLFFADLGRQILLGALLGLPVAAGAVWIMAKMGPLWWLYTWIAWMALNLAAMVVWPMFVAPLFNRFSPLEAGPLRERVEALLARCRFAAGGLFVMDGSKRSSHGNAYFTGFGKARRIVFFDTLLQQLAPDEVEAVLAHELGHYHHRHIVKRVAGLFLMSLVALAVVGAAMRHPWFFAGLGVRGTSDAMALLLFVLVSPVFSFFLTPFASYWSRRCEYEADAYAAVVAGAEPLVRALVRLYRDNAATLTPDPLHALFHDSHPAVPLQAAARATRARRLAEPAASRRQVSRPPAHSAK